MQIVKNNVHMRVVAALLTLWYCMSVIGFGIHTCSESGRSFIVTFIEGSACQDIHPEHICDADLCCSAADHAAPACSCGHDHNDQHEMPCDDEDGIVFKAPSCCSNDYQVLTLTGGGHGEGNQRVSDVQIIAIHHVASEADIHSLALNSGLRAHSLPISQLYARDVRLSCNVWRI